VFSLLIVLLVFFSENLQLIGNDGFGTVFDGIGSGEFENLSTQAVMDLIKNVKCSNQSEVVEIAVEDIDMFNLAPSEVPNNEKISGKFCFIVFGCCKNVQFYIFSFSK
jgi:hypothetical protein